MSRKSTTSKSPARPAPPTKPKGNNRGLWAGALIVVAIVAAFAWWNTSRSQSATSNAAATTGAAVGPASSSPADEAKYLGRFLPAGYKEPMVQPVTYTSPTQMTDVTADTKGAQVTLSLADVTADKIVYFEYPKSGSDPIPMIAYIKPSGLYVGVSYCIPCKGKKQFVDADGTLTCSSCGTKRNLETGVGISGSCRLYPLDEIASKMVAGKIVIEKSALDSWTPQPKDRPIGG